MKTPVALFLLGLGSALLAAAEPAAPPGAPSDWLTRPLSLADALSIADQQNAALLRARSDLEVATGVAIQTRAIVLPKVQASAAYRAVEPGAIDAIPLPDLTIGGVQPFYIDYANQSWSAGIQLVQSVYEGGRMASAVRTARLLKQQAVLQYQATLADVLTEVRVGYYNVLLAEQEIRVQEASTNLLARELEDTQRRYDAGTVPRFNLLRAEVALAGAQPRLIRARNAHRIAKNNLVNLLGHRLPTGVWDDIPLTLSDRLEAVPVRVELPMAIDTALKQRPELAALRQGEALRREAVVSARSGYRPSLQIVGGYGGHSSQFSSDLGDTVHGWSAGAQATWNLFDGALTRGRVREAVAREQKARVDLEDAQRGIELEVRTCYSQFVEAHEVLESQKKVTEQAEEALRLAVSRADAGTGTQLDVLDAQTSLTQARSTQVLALRDYSVAVARLDRAMGRGFGVAPGP